jgi:adenylosuccinate lyase
VNAQRMRTNVEALQGLVFSERLARVIARGTYRASALALVGDWSAVAVSDGRHLRHVALSARSELAGQLDQVFSLAAIVRDLAPVCDETLAGIPGDG